MNVRTEPLSVTFTLSPDSVRGLFDLIAEAAGSDSESRRAARRKEVSKNAAYAGEELPWEVNLMVMGSCRCRADTAWSPSRA